MEVIDVAAVKNMEGNANRGDGKYVAASNSTTLPLPPMLPSGRTFLRYSERLEEFIFTHKTRPPDFKFWPYGPYWPVNHIGPVVETPRFIRNFDCDNIGEQLNKSGNIVLK